MTCPKCGSVESVSKVEAWDAACDVPLKTRKELNRLRVVKAAVEDLLRNSPHPGDAQTVVTTVPVALLDLLTSCLKDPPHTPETEGK